jgi:hypothetical protein
LPNTEPLDVPWSDYVAEQALRSGELGTALKYNTTVAVASDLFARAGVVMTFSKVTN